MSDGGGVDSMLQFRLKMRGDETKHYQKMKRKLRAHLGSMRRKCDTARRCGDVGRRRGRTIEGKGRRRR
jgi:Zn-dependent M16 (insulinase) family peptidase